MFDFVAKHKRLLQVVLALMIVPPFAFWGIQWTQRDAAGARDVASVEGQKISEQEFSDALRQQQDRLRGMLGRNFDPSMFDSPAMRKELIEGMISQRLLTQHASKNYLTVSDEMLIETTKSIPAFQVDGKFSRDRYDDLLRNERMSPEAFDAALRRDLIVQQLSGALADSGIASREASKQIARIRGEQREVAQLVIKGDVRAAAATVTSDAVRAYYDGNPSRFRRPEEVDAEYLVLSAEALAGSEVVEAAEVKAFYEANAARFGTPEQRRASHILIGTKSGASDADKSKARERAALVLAQLRRAPGKFAELAKTESSDPGSASKGGDLGFFSRGMMVKPFEDAAFALKLDQISDLVESDFGFHIIKVTAIKAGKMKSLAEATPEIENELKKQHAGKHFAESAESFSNTVYEQAESLAPAAEKFKLKIRRAEGVTRNAAAVPELNHPKLLAALFGDDAVKNRRNTEAVEVSPGTLVSARVVNHKPPSQRPFEQVREGIVRQLAQQEALAEARKRGAARLEELKKGTASAIRFEAPKLISRENPQGLNQEAVSQVFKADTAKLPSYAAAETVEGYVIYRISRVVDAKLDDVRTRSVQSELGRAQGSQEFRAFLEGLRAGASIDVNQAYLETKQQ